ncbi:MAG: hypothetical protein AAFV53_08040 [Myxococcota bacterium]
MSLTRLLRFIETYSFDHQIYLCIRRMDGGEEEIMFRRGQRSTWTIRSRGLDLPWLERDVDGLLEMLAARDVDTAHLERELLSLVMMNIVHAEEMRREATEMFGPGGIASAVHQFEQMTERLKDAITSAISPEQATKAKASPVRPLLRLVRPKDEPG